MNNPCSPEFDHNLPNFNAEESFGNKPIDIPSLQVKDPNELIKSQENKSSDVESLSQSQN